MLLETPRLVLRRLTDADVPLLYAYSQEPALREQLPDQVYASPDEAADAVAYLRAQYDAGTLPQVYGVQHKQTGVLIGHVGLSAVDDGVEVGYAIAQAHQRNGYAAEAVPAFLQWAYVQWGINPVLGIVRRDNAASCGVLEKAGFVRVSQETRQSFGGVHPVVRYVWQARG